MSKVIFDKEGLLSRVDDDMELVDELMGLFIGELAIYWKTLQDSFAAKDANKFGRTAHGIKSALGNLGAQAAFETAFALEKIGKSEDLSTAEVHLSELKLYIEGFFSEVGQFLGKEYSLPDSMKS